MTFEIRNSHDILVERKPCAKAILDSVCFIGGLEKNCYTIEIDTMQELIDLANELCIANVKITFPLNNRPLIEVDV